jgi:hypothetical protein
MKPPVDGDMIRYLEGRSALFYEEIKTAQTTEMLHRKGSRGENLRKEREHIG